jgi:predicted dehydrogenase
MTLDVGFLGYGLMGAAHANALARLPMFFPDSPRTRRAVLAGRNEETLTAAADRLGFQRTTTDYEEMLTEIDVLYNLTPPKVHPEPTIAALESNVHVLCEKPLAPSIEEAERMARAANRSDAVAGCAYVYRFVPALRLAKRLVDDGALGDIRYFRGQYIQDWQADEDSPWLWRNDADIAGPGSVADQGSHTIDLAQWLVGDIVDVSGRLSTVIEDRPVEGSDKRRPVTNDDVFTIHCLFESGIQGMIEGSRAATGHGNTNTVEIIGSDGALQFDCERINELRVQFDDDRGFQTINVTDDADPYMGAWPPTEFGISWEHTFVFENYEFLRAIDEATSFEPDFETALQTQRIVAAVKRSDETGERIPV